jgi:hypothetical protein
MDGAQACYPYSPTRVIYSKIMKLWCVGRRGGLNLNSFEALVVIPSGTAASADLGGSSEYSNEIFED